MRSRMRSRLEMLDRQERYRRRAAPAMPYILLAFTLLLGITLGVLHNLWRAHDRPDPVLGGVRTAVFPFQVAAMRVDRAFGTAWEWLFTGRRLADENAQLRARLAAMEEENQRLRTGADEARRLRGALSFARRSSHPLLAAEVVGLQPSARFDTLTIARGARDGLKEGGVVRTAEGLVGQVTDVSTLTSTVMLLTDATSGVGGMVVRDGKVQGVGIVQGDGRGKPLQLVYLRREDDVRPGDLVVSSGQGDVYPADIPIGRVVTVREDRPRFLKSAEIRPSASLHHLREVFVLR